jgi:putative DNA methylase
VIYRDDAAALDRATGPRWLSDPRVAEMVRDAILYGASGRNMYELHAWVVMPNHVHVLLSSQLPLSRTLQWLKRTTALRANQILARSGSFWQPESYDHVIRSDREFKETIRYIETNPVSAGLAKSEDEWPWSSKSIG